MTDENFRHCQLCKSKRSDHIKSFETYALVRCKECGFVFMNKTPSDNALNIYYSGYPRNHINSLTLKNYSLLLNSFNKYRQTNNILDVGCGAGCFLQVARKKGWNVYGTEFTDEAIAVCRKKGINAFKGELGKINFKSNYFDVITSFEVLEHVTKPIKEIKLIRELLRDGGAAYITTPNYNSLSRLLLGDKWNIITYPEHLNYFTNKTIKKSFRQHGFSVLSLKTTGISISRLQLSKKSGLKNTSAPTTDDIIRNSIYKYSLMRYLKNLINMLLSLTHKGDTIKILCKK